MLDSVPTVGKAQVECIVGDKASSPGSKQMLYQMYPSSESIWWAGEVCAWQEICLFSAL